jgi:hypothetical protein
MVLVSRREDGGQNKQKGKIAKEGALGERIKNSYRFLLAWWICNK